MIIALLLPLAADHIAAAAEPAFAPVPPEVLAAEPAGMAGRGEPDTGATTAAAAPLTAEIREPDRELIAVLVRRGEELLAAGDLSGARIMLERAAKGGDARAALLLGETYDPTLVDPFTFGSRATDLGVARRWYALAKELGSLDALRRIKALARREPGGDLPSRP